MDLFNFRDKNLSNDALSNAFNISTTHRSLQVSQNAYLHFKGHDYFSNDNIHAIFMLGNIPNNKNVWAMKREGGGGSR